MTVTIILGKLARLNAARSRVALDTAKVHIAGMADAEEEPVMMPFRNPAGTGWHVIVRYHQGHERRIDGFASESEAVDWITANATQVDKEP